jgi:hypothetical protein
MLAMMLQLQPSALLPLLTTSSQSSSCCYLKHCHYLSLQFLQEHQLLQEQLLEWPQNSERKKKRLCIIKHHSDN